MNELQVKGRIAESEGEDEDIMSFSKAKEEFLRRREVVSYLHIITCSVLKPWHHRQVPIH
jgi:hypothetical protein